METIKIKAGATIKLFVEISTEAIVGSLIRLDHKKIRTSELYEFNVDLGLIDDIDNTILSCRTAFEVVQGDATAIYKNTIVNYKLSFNSGEKLFKGVKVKAGLGFFMAFNKVKLQKI